MEGWRPKIKKTGVPGEVCSAGEFRVFGTFNGQFSSFLVQFFCQVQEFKDIKIREKVIFSREKWQKNGSLSVFTEGLATLLSPRFV